MGPIRRSVDLLVLANIPFILCAQGLIPPTIDGHAAAPQGTRSPQDTSFVEASVDLPAVFFSSVAWGDYDNDSDLDLLITGHSSAGRVARLYRNDGSETFNEISTGLPPVGESAAAWGDYDNDGDLDLLMTGSTDSGSGRISSVYRNDSGTFSDISAGLSEVHYGAVAWGDYDNDGDLDLLLTGSSSSGPISRVYRNDVGVFADIDAGLPALMDGSVAWGDYDNDGDLDIVLMGGPLAPLTEIYRNDAGTFNDIDAGIWEVGGGSVVWGDYDNDGDLDLALSGTDGGGASFVYRNDGGIFNDISAGLTHVSWSTMAWGDYDNDGDLDLFLMGIADGSDGRISHIYRNDAGIFADIAAGLPSLDKGSAAWGDFDNDGDLDLVLSGTTSDLGPPESLSALYRSDGAPPNTAPVAPSDLSAVVAGDTAFLSWSSATDAETPPAGLYYNLRIGTTPGGNEVTSGMAESVSGYRRVVQVGNAQQGTEWTVTLPPGSDTYYWSVQAIDGAFAGSAFAPEETMRRPYFVDVGAGLPGIYESSVAWGDYDEDGDLDIVMAGNPLMLTYVYRNDAGIFADVAAGLPGVRFGAVAWGDYDNDGDLDLVVTGYSSPGFISNLYRNDDGTFADIAAGLPGLMWGSVGWGDYDNDGDLDLALTGQNAAWESVSSVYRNDSGAFADIGAGLSGVRYSALAWGDYDNDGDLDLLLTGDMNPGLISQVYRNDSGTFSDITAGLPGVINGSVDWGDYDGDGDLDCFLSGNSPGGEIARIYRNDTGDFADVGAGLLGVTWSSAGWGDYDNDGDLDLLVTGQSVAEGLTSHVYRNDEAAFVLDRTAMLPGVSSSAVAWGDYDNDDDLDLLLTGSRVGYPPDPFSAIYRNDAALPNTVPITPDNLSASVVGDQATFAWSPSSDDQTPANGLTYNLRVGTTPGGDEIFSGMADHSSGYRRVPKLGNAQQNTFWTVTLPFWPGAYYWSVQAVDGAFAGSPFSPEQLLGGAAFTEIDAGLMGAWWSSVAWGDFDNDQDLDLLVTGEDLGAEVLSNLYRNDGGTFVDIVAGLPEVEAGSVAWGDYDGDGDLDLLLTGDHAGVEAISRVYRNDEETFVNDSNATLPGVWYSAAAWGDYDGDGDLDIVLTGTTGPENISSVYRNDAGSFTEIVAGLAGVFTSAVAWGDYDNDGDLDLALAGNTGTERTSRIYRNDAGVLSDIAASLAGVSYSSVAWGDYDNDGDLDLALAGYLTSAQPISRVYRNDSGSFNDLGAGLPGTAEGAVAWGDYDNDGDLDLVLTGSGGVGNVSGIYRNEAGTFVDVGAGLPGVYQSSAAWGDYDDDGDLDVVLTGYDGDSDVISRLFRNESNVANTVPMTPENLSVSVDGNRVTLSWDPSSDAETPPDGLSYNVRIGTSASGNEICPGMAHESSGYRRVINLGNTQHNTFLTVTLPNLDYYYWSVQAVDGGFVGSPFAPEQTFGNLVALEEGLSDQVSFAIVGGNPAMVTARFRYALPAYGRVELSIFNVAGRRVAKLIDEERPPGYHTLEWGNQGGTVPSGVYFAHFKAGGHKITQRFVVLQ